MRALLHLAFCSTKWWTVTFLLNKVVDSYQFFVKQSGRQLQYKSHIVYHKASALHQFAKCTIFTSSQCVQSSNFFLESSPDIFESKIFESGSESESTKTLSKLVVCSTVCTKPTKLASMFYFMILLKVDKVSLNKTWSFSHEKLLKIGQKSGGKMM